MVPQDGRKDGSGHERKEQHEREHIKGTAERGIPAGRVPLRPLRFNGRNSDSPRQAPWPGRRRPPDELDYALLAVPRRRHGSILLLDEYPSHDEFPNIEQQIRAMMDELELACVEYVSDYYAERGEIWYPWEG